MVAVAAGKAALSTLLCLPPSTLVVVLVPLPRVLSLESLGEDDYVEADTKNLDRFGSAYTYPAPAGRNSSNSSSSSSSSSRSSQSSSRRSTPGTTMDDAMESALPNTSSGVTITRRFADGEGLKMKDSVDEPRLWLRVRTGYPS